MFYISILVAFAALLAFAGYVLSYIGNPAIMREQHISAALFITGCTMYAAAWWRDFSMSAFFFFAPALLISWAVYRRFFPRPDQVVLWDKKDFFVHLACIKIALVAAFVGAHWLGLFTGAIWGTFFFYAVSWLLLFPV